MKRLITPIIILLLACATMDAQVFNHLSVGVGAGTDGLTAELAMPVGPFIQIRAGYSNLNFTKGIRVATTTAPVTPGDETGPTAPVPIHVCPAINTGRLIVNVYPGPNTLFYFGIGAFAGASNYINVRGYDIPEGYNTTGFELGGKTIKAYNGTAKAQIRQNAFRPYIGIGFGRPVTDQFCRATFDIGVQYLGNASLWAWGASPSGDDWVEVRREDLGDYGYYYDDVIKYIRFWPTVSLRVWFKTF